MAYILGSITLPQPKRLRREILEQSVEHLLMFGKTTKKVQNRKERYILDYTFLTQAQVNSILSQFELGSALTFQCTDTNMPIGPTTVLMDIQGRDYPPSGEELREDMQIILTEVT